MYEEKRTRLNKPMIIVSLTIAILALGLFTGLSFGLFKKSDAAVVKDTAASSDFAGADDFVVTSSDNLSDTEATIAERLASSSGKVVCAIDPDRFGLLSNVAGVKSDKVMVNGKYVRYLVVPDNVENSLLTNVLGSDYQNDSTRCKNVQDGKFFFFQVTPTVSYYQLPEVGHNEPLVA